MGGFSRCRTNGQTQFLPYTNRDRQHRGNCCIHLNAWSLCKGTWVPRASLGDSLVPAASSAHKHPPNSSRCIPTPQNTLSISTSERCQKYSVLNPGPKGPD